MSKGKVFLTGASGFVGSHIAAQLLDAGFSVKASFRSAQKGQSFADKFPGAPLELEVVPDITTPGAYGNALEGVEFVVHCASPFTFSITDIHKDLLDPAVKGTWEILKAVEASPSVKRIVLTSSFAAVIDPFQNPRPEYVYTEKDWNPVTPEQALQNQLLGYQGSKTFAESKAWDFVEDQKIKGRTISLVTICPPMILGPVHPSSGITSANPNESSAQLLNALKADEAPVTRMPVFADVRDVAAAHVAALDYEKLAPDASERFNVCGGKFTWAAVREIHDGRPVSGAALVPALGFYSIDASKAQRLLGVRWTPLEFTVKATVASLAI